MPRSKLFLVFIISLMISNLVFGALASDSSSAASAIERAEGVTASAYQAILEAERAGADVSDLVDQLNVAGKLLVEAHVQLKNGNFSGAVYLANQCCGIGDGVEAEAQRLKDLAVVEGIRHFWFTIVGWVFSLVVIACGSFFGWHFFKGRYYRRILRMRPEVGSGES